MGTTVGKRLWSMATHSWLKAASPEPVNPARSSRRQPLSPRPLYRAPQRRAWLGSRCLGRRSSRLGVAVGSALLFESGFRRRGAGLLASACSVVGSDSRRLFRPARGLRAARFSVFPDDPPCTPRFFMAAQIMGCASFLSTVASPLPIPRKYQKHYEKPTSRHNRNRDGDDDSKANGKPHGFLPRLVKL